MERLVIVSESEISESCSCQVECTDCNCVDCGDCSCGDT